MKVLNIKSLNEVYDDYSAGIINHSSFIEAVLKHILFNHRYYGILEKNAGDTQDFLSWIYPRFVKSIKRYVPVTGVTFEAFIYSTMRFNFREYLSRHARRMETEQSFWSDVAKDTPYYEESLFEGEESMSPIRKTHKKQSLMVFLKCYHAVSDSMIKRMSSYLGMREESLRAMIDELRKERCEIELSFNELRERCKAQYYRCMNYERRLDRVERGSAAFGILFKRLTGHRERLLRMRRRLKNMRVEATNQQVARVMGIAKGSVDSGISAFKRKYCANPESNGSKN
ncbi:MAG: hypothetical protein Pg6A_08030 [Termitinemataceae bacterium]|nr:MAG: hypothetical protein Pg6A_08030 [Termitinemataceae bacterium]